MLLLLCCCRRRRRSAVASDNSLDTRSAFPVTRAGCDIIIGLHRLVLD